MPSKAQLEKLDTALYWVRDSGVSVDRLSAANDETNADVWFVLSEDATSQPDDLDVSFRFNNVEHAQTLQQMLEEQNIDTTWDGTNLSAVVAHLEKGE